MADISAVNGWGRSCGMVSKIDFYCQIRMPKGSNQGGTFRLEHAFPGTLPPINLHHLTHAYFAQGQ
jgi:hypothetical protein